MIKELKTFLAVVHYGTFEKAGAHIGLTQGAVSGHIRRLEEQLGHSLFIRHGRKTVLNAFGRQTFSRAKHIVEEIQKLRFGVEQAGEPVSYRFGAIYSETTWLVRALAAVRKQHAGASFQIAPGTSHDLTGKVHAGALNLAVVVRPPYQLPAELRWTSLGFEPFVVLAPAAVEATCPIDALRNHPFVRLHTGSYGGIQVDGFLRRHRIQVREAIETDDLEGLVSSVSHGLGVAIVAAIERVTPFPDNIRVLSLAEFKLQREIGVLHGMHFPADAVMESLLAAFLDEARGSFARVHEYLEEVSFSRPHSSPQGIITIPDE